ncbi:MAG: tetratricopeptide repeat protein [Bacteroidales bacterium]|nr:tetratricopeptide repeat protein [Bacteroidales bacterium]
MTTLLKRFDKNQHLREIIVSVVFLFLFSMPATVMAGMDLPLGTDCMGVSIYDTAAERHEQSIQGDTAQLTYADALKAIVSKSERLWLTDKRQSEILIRSAFGIFQKNRENDSLKARAYHLLGKLLVDKQHYRAGVDTLLKCVEIKTNIYGKAHHELSDTSNYLGIACFQMRQYEKAMGYYQQAADILNQSKQISISLFDANLNLGIVSAAKGQYDLAYIYFDNAFFVLDSIGSSFDSLSVARFYLNYGLMATLMGKFDEAIQYYSTAETIYKDMFGTDNFSIARI